MISQPILLGIAGGSGSGKSYFAAAIFQRLGASICEIISQDSFYKDLLGQTSTHASSINFDDPSSIDFDLLVERLAELKAGRRAQIPQYDFCTHRRGEKTTTAQPKHLVVVDGILILHCKKVRDLLDEAIFIDTPEYLRFQRRLERDVRERGRTPDGVHRQFFGQVKPMHDLYVEPSKEHAHVVLSDPNSTEIDLDQLCERLTEKPAGAACEVHENLAQTN